jgi:hypothetical protein
LYINGLLDGQCLSAWFCWTREELFGFLDQRGRWKCQQYPGKTGNGTSTLFTGHQTTHLITTEEEVVKRGYQVNQAYNKDIPVVSSRWVEDCVQAGSTLSTENYELHDDSQKLG